MNHICPKCGNGNWMRRIVGDKSDDIGRLNVKCLNCFSYFNEDDLSGVVKQCTGIKTNADGIRTMTNAELARFFDNIETKNYFGDYLGELGWLSWLTQEV